MSDKMPRVDLQAGLEVHGFRVDDISPLPELRTVAVRLTHLQSGARVLHLCAADPENLMAIGFRTPPADNTGLPHILEHTVLCGSRKYPVKDPFVELLKTSLATFLNAMTYPDKTVYPCASMNRRDFFNAAGVYCDAVFHPRITENHFKQEGHHFAFAEPGRPESALTIKGIVYNEMKGVYSTLDGIMWRASEGLFPDNAYGLDSGGSPDAIPSLTYEQFKAFHARYYHPSNAFIVLYGDIPTADHLKFLHTEYLREFQRIELDTSIALQPRWTMPRSARVDYPAAPDETPEKKTAHVILWLTNAITDAVETQAMGVLGEYLLGHAGSPLRKALIDSKLGEDVTFEGYSAFRRETMFSVGLKGTAPDRVPALRQLVFDTCRKIADEGLQPGPLESCFHQYELAARDIPSQYPLVLMDRVLNSWIYDADPLALLRPRAHLAELRRRAAAEPRFFETRLRRQVLDNPHRLELTFLPDPELNARREREFAARMAKIKALKSRAELERIASEAEELDRMQSAPNTPEALATLPRLHLGDVSEEPMRLDTSVLRVAGRPLLRTDVFANGLNFLQLAADLRGLPEELVDYLPLFAEALVRTGAGDLDYAAMAERESSVSGGVSAAVGAGGRHDDPWRVMPMLSLGASALDEKIGGMLSVVSDRLCRARFGDVDRLRDIVVQSAVRRRNAVVPSGSSYAVSYAQRGLSRNAGLAERFGGLTQVRFMEMLSREFGSRRASIVEKLERIRAFVLERPRFHASFVGADAPFAHMTAWYEGLIGGLREANAPGAEPSALAAAEPRREAVALPAEVAFVARAFNAVGGADPHAPALMLLSTQLSYGYLWNEVRVRHGAYGAHARFDAALGTFALSSYRDPAIGGTLRTFDGIVDHVLRDMDLSPGALEQSIIGTVKGLDRPIRPSAATGIALTRFLTGLTDDHRREFRHRLLTLRAEEIRHATEDVLRPGLRNAPVCVISGREKLVAANDGPDAAGLKIEDL